WASIDKMTYFVNMSAIGAWSFGRPARLMVRHMQLTVDGKTIEIDAEADMPLLWALRDLAGILGPKFGCGIAACGACTVLVDGAPVRSCVTPVGEVQGAVATIEGLARGGRLHRVQQAWVEEQVAQCGYCQAGQIM